MDADRPDGDRCAACGDRHDEALEVLGLRGSIGVAPHKGGGPCEVESWVLSTIRSGEDDELRRARRVLEDVGVHSPAIEDELLRWCQTVEGGRDIRGNALGMLGMHDARSASYACLLQEWLGASDGYRSGYAQGTIHHGRGRDEDVAEALRAVLVRGGPLPDSIYASLVRTASARLEGELGTNLLRALRRSTNDAVRREAASELERRRP